MLDIFAKAVKGVGWVSLLWFTLPALLLFCPTSKFLREISHHTVEIIDTISLTVGQVVKWALPLLVLTVAASVFALSLFGLSWTKLFESAQYLHATVIMLGAAMTLLLNEHVRVDIFQSRLKRPQKALVDFIGFHTGLMPVCLLLIWSSNSFIGFSWQILEGSAESDGIRGLYLLKTLIPAFAVMLLAQGLSIALRAVMVMRKLDEPKRPSHVHDLFPEAKGIGQ
ncbi:MAG: TRAP transporter small permease subunit [Maricaulaceae bacterium]